MLKQTPEKRPNTKDFFGTEHLKSDLRGRSIRGGAVTAAAQAGKFVLQMASTVVLGRLLTPEDYGLIAMVTVVIKFVRMFKNLGLSTATIQQKEINHQQVSTLFWINVGISLVITLILVVLAPIIAGFYSEPRLIPIMFVLASVFIFSGLSVQHEALLKRQMRFTSIAKIAVISLFLSLVVAIILAWNQAGYWSLVFLQLTSGITYAAGMWFACSWRPGLPVWDSGIRSMLAFGGNLTAFNCLNYVSRNLDNLLIGRYWGSQQLGLYAKAYQLILLPIQQINAPMTGVALPTLSCLQTQREQYCRYYYKALLSISTLGMALVAFTFAAADKMIPFFLGQQWLEVIPIFRLLMPAAFIGTLNVAEAWAYQSLGRTDRQFRLGLVVSAIDVIIFIVSVHWGAIGVAAAFGLSRPILWVPRILYCYKGTPLRFTELLKTLSHPVLASLGAAALLMGMNQLLSTEMNLAIVLGLDCLIYGLLYLAIWIVLPRGRKTLWEMMRTLKEFRKKKK
ncbi:MAG: lipopolysaccharide biosynthesis protein [Xenococcaceae cyanobacterium MO_188.B29]|nr:lipopolysaccharide biosynthesis protein [Xenococcaceae cyanobacterium MO_188.B29]